MRKVGGPVRGALVSAHPRDFTARTWMTPLSPGYSIWTAAGEGDGLLTYISRQKRPCNMRIDVDLWIRSRDIDVACTSMIHYDTLSTGQAQGELAGPQAGFSPRCTFLEKNGEPHVTWHESCRHSRISERVAIGGHAVLLHVLPVGGSPFLSVLQCNRNATRAGMSNRIPSLML